MTEAEWLACSDPKMMLEFLRGKASDRKLRLFAVACCRRIWHLLPDKAAQQAVEVAEQSAEGLVQAEALRQACVRAEAAYQERRKLANQTHCLVEGFDPYWTTTAIADASRVASLTAMDMADLSTRGLSLPELVALLSAGARQPEHKGSISAIDAEKSFQSNLLCEIFGNPFRSPKINARELNWNDGIVPKMAQSVYEQRAFDRLPVLADVLEEAGCTDADILAHCRQPGLHVRGCWVVDLLLKK